MYEDDRGLFRYGPFMLLFMPFHALSTSSMLVFFGSLAGSADSGLANLWLGELCQTVKPCQTNIKLHGLSENLWNKLASCLVSKKIKKAERKIILDRPKCHSQGRRWSETPNPWHPWRGNPHPSPINVHPRNSTGPSSIIPSTVPPPQEEPPPWKRRAFGERT